MYIGQTSGSLERRKNKHIRNAFQRGLNNKFYQALRKYGKDVFDWGILEEDIPIGRLDDREMKWIAIYKSLNEGYNMTMGGQTIKGYKHTRETRDKIGKRMKGRSMKDHYISVYGKIEGMKKYDEYIEKLNKANGKGRTRLELFIERHGKEEGTRRYGVFIESIKEARRNNPSGFKDKTFSKETKKIIAENTSRAQKGRKKSEEHKRKISEGRKKHWANKKKGKD